MTLRIGRNININDTATVSSAISTNTSTSVVVAVANPDRIFFCVNHADASQDVFIKLQAASVDNDKKGIHLGRSESFMMPTDNMYLGEISAIAENGSPDVFFTEY